MPPDAFPITGIAQIGKQLLKLVGAAMHVADEIERTVIRLPVVPERLPLDGRDCDLVGR